MCECGCTTNNEAYRLPGGKGFFYVIELYAGCDNCTAGPGVLVRKITRESYDHEDVKDAQLLPLHTHDKGMTECAIALGLDPDTFRKEAIPIIDGYPTGRRKKLDEHDGYEIADRVWKEVIRRRPDVVTVTPARKDQECRC